MKHVFYKYKTSSVSPGIVKEKGRNEKRGGGGEREKEKKMDKGDIKIVKSGG